MNIFETLKKATHRFDILDLAMFETYLFSVGLLFLVIFPSLATLSVWIYISIIIIGIALMTYRLTKKKGDTLYRIYWKEQCLHVMERLSIFHITVYKILCVASGIAVGIFFPVIISGPLWLYVGLVAFGVGYFIDHMKNFLKKPTKEITTGHL